MFYVTGTKCLPSSYFSILLPAEKNAGININRINKQNYGREEV